MSAPTCKICKAAHWNTEAHRFKDAPEQPQSDASERVDAVACPGCIAYRSIIGKLEAEIVTLRNSNVTALQHVTELETELERNNQVLQDELVTAKLLQTSVTPVTPSVTLPVTRNKSRAEYMRAYRARNHD